MTVGLVSGGGYFRRTAVVAMAMFLQYWYWFPMAYLLPLAFKTTALIGVTEDLKLPRFEVTCACKKGTFAYAKPVTDNSKKKVRRCALLFVRVAPDSGWLMVGLSICPT